MFFSIVIPTYNRARLLERAITSVLAQDYSDFEVIVADDASTDNTAEVVARFDDSRIRYLRSEQNGGNAAARNLGAKHARGEYIAFLDSDDQYHPDFLSNMQSLILANDRPGFLWCGVNRMTADGRITIPRKIHGWQPEKAKDAYRYFLNGIYFGTDCGFTVRKDCLVAVGYFDERLRVSVDTDLILRIVQHCNFAYTREKWLDTFDHAGQRVRKDVTEKARAYELIFEKHRTSLETDARLLTLWRYKLMWLLYHSGRRKAARKHFVFFLRRLRWKAVATGCIFELLPLTFAIRIHRYISGD